MLWNKYKQSVWHYMEMRSKENYFKMQNAIRELTVELLLHRELLMLVYTKLIPKQKKLFLDHPLFKPSYIHSTRCHIPQFPTPHEFLTNPEFNFLFDDFKVTDEGCIIADYTE